MIGCACIECLNFGDENSCNSIYEIKFDGITTTSMSLFWNSSETAITYLIGYKIEGASSWTTLPSIAAPNTEVTIINLTPDTIYNFKIFTECENSECESLTFKAKTL